MKILCTVFAVGLTLGGCVSAQQEEHAKIKLGVQEAVSACQARKFSTNAAGAQCVANAQAPLAATMGPLADLHMLLLAKRVAIWEQVDKKQLSVAQANAEIAQVNAAINSEAQRRVTAIQSARAQQEAAEAQQMAAITASNAANAYRPRYCSRFGNSVTCF